MKESLSKFVGSTEKLNKMLRYRKCPNGKSGNGYKGKKRVHDEETIVRYFCQKVGHIDVAPLELVGLGSSSTIQSFAS